MSLGLGFIEILIILAVVWAIAHVYYRHPVKSQSGQDKPLGDKFGHELGRVARSTGDTLQGRYGKKWQVIGIIALLFFAWWGRDFAWARLAYLAILIFGGVLLYRVFQDRNADSRARTSTPPVPPPLPPHARAANREDRDRSEFVSERRSGSGFFKLLSVVTLLLFAAGAVVFVLRLGGFYVVMRKLGDAALVQRLESGEDFDPAEIAFAPQTVAQREGGVPLQRAPQGPDVLIPVTPVPPVPPIAPLTPQIVPVPGSPPRQVAPYAPVTVPPQTVVPPTESEGESKTRKNDSGQTVAALSTDPYPSDSEAQQAALAMASRYLSRVLAQSGLAFTQWQPSLSWTRRNFVESIRVEKVQRGDVTVFVGHADVRVPDEKKVQQIWNEFVRDQASGRSLLVLKIFGGAVFLIGGLAVLLRLGTGRHLSSEPVSLKKRWFGRKQPAKV